MTLLTNWLPKIVRSTYNHNAGYNICPSIFIQTRDYAARKGTRERKAKLRKRKVVVEKVGFVPFKKSKDKVKKEVCPLITIDDSRKPKATDDVWAIQYHQEPVYSVKEAIECHRELHHPTMMNTPNAPLNVFIDLNMQREKKTKFMDKFSKVVSTPHIFKSGEDLNKTLVFCKNLAQQEKARDAGADFVGGTELVKQIQNGDFSFKEFDYVISHADMLTDLLLIRGLLKRKFPNVRTGNMGVDMAKLVTKFKAGIEYTAIPHATFKEYGYIDTTFGLLQMETNQLEENLSSLINDVESMRPKREGPFIVRVCIQSKISNESFKIDFKQYLPVPEVQEETNEPEDNPAVISTH
ncbi:mitochondrial ribosomal protein L1 [Xylocopa sonorina]|uniref:mitochondrial ribosomal protein L1 n=1 Tax=Xylocopa sonorina TaxID=1818115 RepID=UPI00403AAC8A